MFNQYFGQYLLNKGSLTAEQLHSILSLERMSRPKLGVLAIDAGLMTAVQVERVHEKQHALDKKFGEIAIELEYVTFQQLESLLALQQSQRLNLSQAIVDKGYLSLSQLETALINYKKEANLTSGQWDALYNSDSSGIVRTFLDFSAAGPQAEVLYEYVALMLRTILRFFGEEPIIACNINPVSGYAFFQELTGSIRFSTWMVMENPLMLEMAQRYSGETFTGVCELALDSIGEFLNETNGIFTVNLSDKGVELNLQPQQILQPGEMPQGKTYHVPIGLGSGTIDLYIAAE